MGWGVWVKACYGVTMLFTHGWIIKLVFMQWSRLFTMTFKKFKILWQILHLPRRNTSAKVLRNRRISHITVLVAEYFTRAVPARDTTNIYNLYFLKYKLVWNIDAWNYGYTNIRKRYLEVCIIIISYCDNFRYSKYCMTMNY